MHNKFTIRVRRILSALMGVGIALILLTTSSQASTAFAQEAVIPPAGNYYSVNTIRAQDGTLIEKHSINGPSVPPAGFESERQPVKLPISTSLTENVLSAGGGSSWVLGCSATAAGDIITIYDQDKYPDLYTGSTGNGVLPIGSNPWPTFIDSLGIETSTHPVIASMKGVDGRTIFGTIDDYYIGYESALPDPYLGYGGGNTILPRLTGNAMDFTATAATGWAQHAWGDAVGDYMYTSQSAFGNVDGETQFYTYANSATPFTCEEISKNALPDGTLGIKQFYQARGYAVGVCYNQPTDNVVSGGFSFAKLKIEIDAGRPVILNLEGHTVVGVGYNASSNLVYIHDGWDYETHSMTWGGSYVGLALRSVSIVNIVPGTPAQYTISGNAGMANATITYTGGFTTTDTNGNYSFTVTESWFGTVTPSKDGYNFTPPNRSYNNIKENHTVQDYIATDSDFPRPFSKIDPSNGMTNQPDIVVLSWETSIGTASYEYCYDTTNDNTCSNWTSNGSSTSKALSLSASTTYYWHVRAVNSSGTTYSNNSPTAFWSFTTSPLTPVQAIDAWTGDTNWNQKTLFAPGDPIRWALIVENTTSSNQSITLAFVVKNPNGNIIENIQGSTITQPGTWSWYFNPPGTAPTTEGIYTFTGSVIHQGIRTTKSTTYTVAYPCYTLSKSVIGNGSININPPPNCTTNETQYRQGTTVQLTASPYLGYGFDGWGGDSTGSLNPISITLTGDKSITASFSLLPPAAPELTSPPNGAVLDDYSPTLGWNDLAVAPDHYQLQFATSSDFTSGVLYNQNLTGSTFDIPALLISGNVYYWRVRAFNSLGAGSWSQTWVLSMKLAPVNLIAPGKDVHVLTLRPTFDWSDVSNTNIYTVQVSPSASFLPVLMNESTQTSNFTPWKDLPPAQILYWRVRSEGGGGTSNWSEVRAFTTPNPPSIPLLISPSPDAMSMDYQPLFKWMKGSVPRVTLFDHYQIQISTRQDFSILTINENLNGLSTTMYTPATSLIANTQYYWRMRAYNTDNEASSWSEIRSFHTPNPMINDNRPGSYGLAPVLPQPVIVSPSGDSTSNTLQPVLDWADVPEATSYIVQISTDSAFSVSSLIVSATTIDSQYAVLKDVPTRVVLYWRVLALHEEKTSNWSPISNFSAP